MAVVPLKGLDCFCGILLLEMLLRILNPQSSIDSLVHGTFQNNLLLNYFVLFGTKLF